MSNIEALSLVRFTFHLSLNAFCIKEIRAPSSDGEVVRRACGAKIVLLRVMISSNVTGVVVVSADGERKWKRG